MIIRSLLILTFTAAPALAQGICASPEQIEAINSTISGYGDVLSDISCDAPVLAAHVMLCNSDRDLWWLEVAATQSFVYAYENATGTETDHGNPPRADDVIAARDACTDEACLCDVLTSAVNDNLGGLSPFND